MALTDSLNTLLGAITGIQPPSHDAFAAALAKSPKPADAPTYAPTYNDHSTSDKWMALLGGIVPSLAPLASQIIGSHRSANAAEAARFQGDNLANLLSGPPRPSAAPSAAPTNAQQQAPKADMLAPITGKQVAPPAPIFDASPQGAMAWFVDHGYDPADAAAIAAQGGPESSWKTDAFNPKGGGKGAVGLFQWRGPRQTAFRQYAQSNGLDPTDPTTQYAFVDRELKTTHAHALQAIQGLPDAAAKAAVFNKTYEVPGNVPASYLNRVRNEGLKAYAAYQSALPPPPSPPETKGPAVQAAAPSVADSAAPAAAQAPTQQEAKEAFLHAAPQEVAAFKTMYANPLTRDEAIKYATKLIQQNASPEMDATIVGNQVVHLSKDPRIPASVETVAGLRPAPPSGYMYDPQTPDRVVPIPGTEKGPLQHVQGMVGGYQRQPDGSFVKVGEESYGGGLPNGTKADTAGLPPGAQRFPGVAGVWQRAPTGKWEKVADDGQTAAGPAGDFSKTGDDYLKTLPNAQALQVKALAEGRMAFPSGFALRSPYWQTMLQAVGQYDPSFDAVNYNARSKTRNDFTSGKAAGDIKALNTAIGHIGQLDQAINNLGNNRFPLNNAIANWIGNQTGDPRVKQFETDRNAVVAETVRVFRGGVGSAADIKEWTEKLNAADSPEQLHGVVSELAGLLDSRLQAVGDQYNKGMGTTSDPLTLLSPHAAETYRRIREGKNGGEVQVLTPEQATKLRPGQQFRTTDGRLMTRQ